MRFLQAQFVRTSPPIRNPPASSLLRDGVTLSVHSLNPFLINSVPVMKPPRPVAPGECTTLKIQHLFTNCLVPGLPVVGAPVETIGCKPTVRFRSDVWNGDPDISSLIHLPPAPFDRPAFLLYRAAMTSRKPSVASSPTAGKEVVIDRTADVLTFTLDNSSHGNEVTGVMFDAMLAELRKEASKPRARVLRIRARGHVFCTGRERAGRTPAAIRRESARILKFKAALRSSPLISVAELQGDAFGFGFGLAIVCDFALVAEHASLGFPEMRSGLAPAAIMSYLGEYALPRFAFPLVLFGDPIDPHRAQQIGLISHVCPADRLSAEAEALVERILRLDRSAVRRCKSFFLNAQQNSFDRNCRLAVDALTKGSLASLARKK